MRLVRRLIWLAAFAAAGMAPVGLAGAQPVLLQIRPHVGDTIRMRLDQQTEMSGVRDVGGSEKSTLLVNTMRLFSRAIVEGASERGATILAVTDSVLLSTTDAHAQAALTQSAEALRGQHVRFHVLPDGSVGMGSGWSGSGDDGLGDGVGAASVMPAAFPRKPIAVGETWSRDMPLPAGGPLGAQVSGQLHMIFRLDSLARGGDRAFVSMRGDVQPATGPGAASGAVLDKGFVDGTMLIDRKRGWMTDSWFTIVVNSTAAVSPTSGIASMRMQMRITQHMHAMDRR